MTLNQESPKRLAEFEYLEKSQFPIAARVDKGKLGGPTKLQETTLTKTIQNSNIILKPWQYKKDHPKIEIE